MFWTTLNAHVRVKCVKTVILVVFKELIFVYELVFDTENVDKNSTDMW